MRSLTLVKVATMIDLDAYQRTALAFELSDGPVCKQNLADRMEQLISLSYFSGV